MENGDTESRYAVVRIGKTLEAIEGDLASPENADQTGPPKPDCHLPAAGSASLLAD
jgi:hypothetical protein